MEIVEASERAMAAGMETTGVDPSTGQILVPINAAPSITSRPRESTVVLNEGDVFQWEFEAFDPDGDATWWAVADRTPLGNWTTEVAVIDGGNGTFTFTAPWNEYTYYFLTVTVYDQMAATASHNFSVSVQDINRPPDIKYKPVDPIAREGYAPNPRPFSRVASPTPPSPPSLRRR